MKKLTLSLLTAALLCPSAIAQKNDKYVGATGSLQYNITTLEKESNINSYTNYRAALSYSYNIALNLGLSNKLSLTTGLGLSYFRYKYDQLDGIGPATPSGNVASEHTISIAYLKIPIKFEYMLMKKEKVAIGPTLGSNFWFYAYSHDQTENADGLTTNVNYYNANETKFVASLQFGIKAQYYISDKMSLTLEPFYEQGFKEVLPELMVKPHLNLGAYLSVFYKI